MGYLVRSKTANTGLGLVSQPALTPTMPQSFADALARRDARLAQQPTPQPAPSPTTPPPGREQSDQLNAPTTDGLGRPKTHDEFPALKERDQDTMDRVTHGFLKRHKRLEGFDDADPSDDKGDLYANRLPYDEARRIAHGKSKRDMVEENWDGQLALPRNDYSLKSKAKSDVKKIDARRNAK